MAYMSQEGYDKLVADLKQLESVERPKASAAIAEARDKGDLSENAEYDAAKEAQAHLEEKINRLKVAIAEAKIIDTSRLSTDTVQILSKVVMTNLANKAKMSYTIVSESEANLREGSLSLHLSLRACSTRRWATKWRSRFRAALSTCASIASLSNKRGCGSTASDIGKIASLGAQNTFEARNRRQGV